jgi:hypothetical protein
MVSHKRFLTRQYKYKCLDMPHRFLLIFSHWVLKEFLVAHRIALFPLYELTLKFSYKLLNEAISHHMSYFLFSPPGFLKEVNKTYLFSKLTNELFPL